MAFRMVRLIAATLFLSLAAVAAAADGKPYMVVEGDTLYGIARHLQVPTSVLQSLSDVGVGRQTSGVPR